VYGYRYHAPDGASGIWCGRHDGYAQVHAARDKLFDVAYFFFIHGYFENGWQSEVAHNL
jgi:hypothetical protein